MAREALDRKISQLKDELLLQGSMVEQMTLDSVQALVARDLDEAKRIYNFDSQVNLKHLEIEKGCLSLITTEPPILATDLRVLTSLLDVNTIIERIGDAAKGIARICLSLGLEPPLMDFSKISGLTNQIMAMFHRALGVFMTVNRKTAEELLCDLGEIRNSTNEINREIFTLVIANPTKVNLASKILWVVHSLEMMAGLVTDICDRTFYISTGILANIQPAVNSEGINV